MEAECIAEIERLHKAFVTWFTSTGEDFGHDEVRKLEWFDDNIARSFAPEFHLVLRLTDEFHSCVTSLQSLAENNGVENYASTMLVKIAGMLEPGLQF